MMMQWERVTFPYPWGWSPDSCHPDMMMCVEVVRDSTMETGTICHVRLLEIACHQQLFTRHHNTASVSGRLTTQIKSHILLRCKTGEGGNRLDAFFDRVEELANVYMWDEH